MNAWYSAHVVLFQTTAIYAVLALSFQVVLRSGVFSFASVGFFGIGAYVSANLAKHGVSGVLSMIIVFVGSAIFGYALSLPLVRLRGLYLGMVTFAFDQILIVVANNGGTYTGGPVGLFGIPFDVSTLELFIVAAICLLLVSQLERRSIGRSISVLRVDEQLARSMGVEVNRQRNFIFALSAALGGLAGVLNTFNFSTIAPGGFGFDLIVAGLTMAVVGGIGSWLGDRRPHRRLVPPGLHVRGLLQGHRLWRAGDPGGGLRARRRARPPPARRPSHCGAHRETQLGGR